MLCASLALLAVLLATSGCANTPQIQAVRQFLGLRQTFPHSDLPAPATSAGYAALLGFGQTQTITFRDPVGKQEKHITDAQAIAQVVTVLRLGPNAQPAA